MESKRLNLSFSIPAVLLREPGEISVPAGESRYLIVQSGDRREEQSYTFVLDNPDSRVLICGLVIAQGHETPRLQVRVEHRSPRSQAETMVRTLSFDHAAPRFEGLLHIQPDAAGSQSFLNHHSLLIGETAASFSLPSLEIETDEVRCSHAATIRTITDRDLFYLRSRGLSAAEAARLAIEAFVADIGIDVPTELRSRVLS